MPVKSAFGYFCRDGQKYLARERAQLAWRKPLDVRDVVAAVEYQFEKQGAAAAGRGLPYPNALTHRLINPPEKIPSASIATPLIDSMVRKSTGAVTGAVFSGSSKYISLTTRR